MRDYKLIRNIGIAAHIDAGKTTLSERMLFIAGKIHRMGEVHHGDAVLDHGREEQKRGITISSAATQLNWNRNSDEFILNLIDTPGHVDFTVEVERSLRVLDGAVAVFSAVGGVEPQSETVWRQANRYEVPRIAFVNKMDLDGADYLNVIDQMRKRLAANAFAIQLPIFEGHEFVGLVDIISEKAYRWDDLKSMEFRECAVPNELLAELQSSRNDLLEALAENDAEMLDLFLERPHEINEWVIRKSLRKAVIAQQVVPVLAGTAYRNKGVQQLLDAVCDFLPTPAERNELIGWDTDDSELEVRRSISEEAPFTALAFKVALDEQNRRMVFLRVYAGNAATGSTVWNARTGKRERLAAVYQMHGGKRQALDQLHLGDIAAVVGLKDVRTGDTLTVANHPMSLESMTFPEPVVAMSIEAGNSSELVKMANALARLSDEDPTFRVTQNKETGQTIIQGMGELHLEVCLSRLRNDFDVDCKVGEPQVSYKELFTKPTIQKERLVKQDGGSGLFAVIEYELGPADAEFLESDAFKDGKTRLQFVNEVRGGAIPADFIPSVRKGFEQAMNEGVLEGHPMDSMKVRLLDGQTHVKDSKPLAFEIVAQRAFRSIAAKAQPTLLEPIMQLEISTPEEALSNVISGINKRRGLLLGIDSRVDVQIVRAHVPLKELFGYVAALRSATSGRASSSITFAHFAPLVRDEVKA